jgi:hypothetical protein
MAPVRRTTATAGGGADLRAPRAVAPHAQAWSCRTTPGVDGPTSTVASPAADQATLCLSGPDGSLSVTLADPITVAHRTSTVLHARGGVADLSGEYR